MAQRIVETEQARTMLFRFIEKQKLPFTANITSGGKRTVRQNRLNRLWMQEIAEQTGTSVEEARGFCKLTIGVPILRAQNDDFRKKYDRQVKPYSYEQKMKFMMEPWDFPVTRLMTVQQQTEYLNAVHRHFSEQGIVLTDPGDLLRQYEPQSSGGSDDAAAGAPNPSETKPAAAPNSYARARGAA